MKGNLDRDRSVQLSPLKKSSPAKVQTLKTPPGNEHTSIGRMQMRQSSEGHKTKPTSILQLEMYLDMSDISNLKTSAIYSLYNVTCPTFAYKSNALEW